MDLEFSVGFTMTATVLAAILALPKIAWTPAINADGSLRDGADVAELTGVLGDLNRRGWPLGMRVIVRSERPHPGAGSASLTRWVAVSGLRHRHPRRPVSAA